MDAGAIAEGDWFLRARVRVTAATRTAACRGMVVRPPRYWWIGEEVELFQWGRAGQPVDRTGWWTSLDPEAAYIIPCAAVEVLEILEELPPAVREARIPEPPDKPRPRRRSSVERRPGPVRPQRV